MAQPTEFKGFFRAAGISALLAAIFIAAGISLAIVSGRPPDATADEVLRQIHSQRFLFVTSQGAFILGSIFLIPLMPALYLALKHARHTHALLSLALGATGVVTVLMDNVLGYSLARLSERFADAEGIEKVAAVVAADTILASSRVALVLFQLLFGVATFAISLAMLRAVFPRTLAVLGLVTGVSSIIGGIFVQTFFPAIVVSNVLYIIWLIGLGYTLYRK